MKTTPAQRLNHIKQASEILSEKRNWDIIDGQIVVHEIPVCKKYNGFAYPHNDLDGCCTCGHKKAEHNSKFLKTREYARASGNES